MAVKKKTATKKATQRSEMAIPQSQSLKATAPTSKYFSGRKRLYLVAAIILIAVIAFAYRGLFVAALVNGEPISRLSVVSELEKQGGKQMLDSLITRSLILQEARMRNIEVTEEDTKADIAKIEESYKKQGQTLDQVLEMYGVTREDVAEQRKPWILLEKMVGEDVKVTDEEVAKYIEENNEAFGGTLTEKQVTEDLRQEKLQAKQEELIQSLREKANIQHLVNY